MAWRYDENPLLFVTSTDSSVPNGRNVRSAARTQCIAAQQAKRTEQVGQFAVIDFSNKRRHEDEDKQATRKQRKASRPRQSRRTGALRSKTHAFQPSGLVAASTSPALPTLLVEPQAWPLVQNPSDTLVVATFHIRRIAAMVLRQQPERLLEVLRFRQWSCVSIAREQPVADPCLNCALACLASKLSRMTGGGQPDYTVLSSHTEALHALRAALLEPRRHSLQDLLTTTQLLAIFEMLDSLDNEVWVHHVAGAKSLLLSKDTTSPTQSQTRLSFSAIAPILADALYVKSLTIHAQPRY